MGRVLHGLRGTLHVHEDAGRSFLRDYPRHFRVEQGRSDVVHDVRTRIERFVGHGSVEGVNADGEHGPPVAYGIDDGNDPSGFLRCSDRRCTGPRALAAHVEDVHALVHHALGNGQRLGKGPRPASDVERVGGGVDDAHDARNREIQWAMGKLERCRNGLVGKGRIHEAKYPKPTGAPEISRGGCSEMLADAAQVRIAGRCIMANLQSVCRPHHRHHPSQKRCSSRSPNTMDRWHPVEHCSWTRCTTTARPGGCSGRLH